MMKCNVIYFRTQSHLPKFELRMGGCCVYLSFLDATEPQVMDDWRCLKNKVPLNFKFGALKPPFSRLKVAILG